MYWVDADNDRSIKKIYGPTVLPFSILRGELGTGQMSQYASHGDRAVPPRWTKRKIKLIILDILITDDIPLLASVSSGNTPAGSELDRIDLSAGQMLSHRFCNRGFLCDTKNLAGHTTR